MPANQRQPGSKGVEWCLIHGLVCTASNRIYNIICSLGALKLRARGLSDLRCVPSQANDRSVVDMHQKLTANDERPWAD